MNDIRNIGISNVETASARSDVSLSKGSGTDFSSALKKATETAQANFLPIKGSGPNNPALGPKKMSVLSDRPAGMLEPLHERALKILSMRQEVIASNIANADTPGFKARDIDVTSVLRNGWDGMSKPELKFQIPTQASIDGNTVELDTEMGKSTKNAIMYEFELSKVSGYYKSMEDLLKGTPY